MTLILRLDETEHVLRSVGETAPGIVCAGQLDDRTFSFTASATWTPSAAMEAVSKMATERGLTGAIAEPGSIDPSMVPFSAQEAVDACVDDTTVGAVIQGAQACFETTWQLFGKRGHIDETRACLDFVEEVYQAAAERMRRSEAS